MSDPTLERIARLVESRLEEVFDAADHGAPRDWFEPFSGSLLLERVRDMTLRPGKRLRPAMVVCGAGLFTPRPELDKAVLDAAAAMELIHVYFLIHDDIMDDGATRRGGPSVHAALTARTGDARLGVNLAILCGDLAMALHEELVAGLDAPEPRRRLVATFFSRMHRDVIHGQSMDLLGADDFDEVARRKTASYTTVGPLMIGGALGGAGEAELSRLFEIGVSLGVAFQLEDDLLDAFGDPALTGKPVGADLLSGKRTFLVAEALRLANADGQARIRGAFGAKTVEAAVVASALAAIEECGARRACQDRVERLVGEARAAVERGAYLEWGRSFLTDMGDMIARRRT